MKEKIIVIGILVVLFIGTIGLSGCTMHSSDYTFFNGDVLIGYRQFISGKNDTLIITFYKSGTYNLSFKPALVVGSNKTYTINESPRSIIISQYKLPDYLVVTIERNGIQESYKFF